MLDLASDARVRVVQQIMRLITQCDSVIYIDDHTYFIAF